MGTWALKIVDFFIRQKILFFLCLAVFICFISIGISRLKITESIFSTLPKGKSFEQLNTLIENKNISNQVVFSLKITDKTDADEVAELASSFADTLKKIPKKYLTEIVAERPDVSDNVYNYFYENFPLLIDSDYYKAINEKLNEDSIKASLITSYNQLVSPGSSFLKKYLLNDPIFLTSDFFKNLNSTANSEEIIVEDGIIFTKDKKQILILAKTNFGAGNSEANISLFHLMEDFKMNWNKTHSENEMDYFGTFAIAAENAIQVKKDTKLTVSLSLIIILLILFLYYKKLLIPIYFFLPTIFGGAFAIGVMGFLKPEISAISLATGAVLLGIIVDYSFHFFTHLRHTRSVSVTIKEISVPLFTGSFTTITALTALCFANSTVLQDFGLLSALSLSGAAIFTLTALPILLKIFSFDYQNIPDEPIIFKLPSLSPKYRKLLLAGIVILTLFFLYFSKDVQFDSDLNNLSFHSENLKNKEEELTGINPQKEKKIYLFASDKSYNKACAANFQAFEKLVEMKSGGEIKSFLSTAQFLIPQDIKDEREKQWTNFWDKNKSQTFALINKTADSIGFSKSAFENFEKWINKDFSSVPQTLGEGLSVRQVLQLLGLSNLVEVNYSKTTLITTVIVQNENLEAVKKELRKIEGIEIFDRAETASSLLDLVKSDFNYILWISASIVFFTLLLIYGRIELTLLAFIPMVVSWIWILGIAGLLGIKFNFVNVVISTFVFGLGDDYSIFTTDGLLNKYKYRKNSLSSYTSAIILSAVTTMIGIGVLFFAKHPAIHSIAAISVWGIVCILFLSLVLQPILFDFFVQKRIEKKKSPIPLSEFLYSIFEFSYFVLVCLFFYIIWGILFLLPFPRKSKRIFLNRLISFFAWTVIYFDLQVKKKTYGKENLVLEKPSIIIANHSSFLDILLMILLDRRIILMVKDWVYHSPLFGYPIRYAGYIYTESGTEQNLDKIKERVVDGYSILIFPEGTRSPDDKMQRFHKGAFYLSQELKLDITPILIHGASYVLPKNDYLVKTGELNLKVLPRIKHDDISWGNTYRERTKSISQYFKSEYLKFKNERETASYLWQRIFNNYIFKGPIIEWYIRIKWKLEQKNYEFYNEQIGERKNILDIGCGYGYLSLYLHYKNENRKIIGVDYDEEKINIVANCYDKNENLSFNFADVKTFSFENQDVIFLNDILHYLSEENQQVVLEKCASALNSDGIIFIRDGITDFADRHKTTKLSEYFSTKIFQFNKKENEFCFPSIELIRSFAERNKLSFEMKEHSQQTSNVLFILKKK